LWFELSQLHSERDRRVSMIVRNKTSNPRVPVEPSAKQATFSSYVLDLLKPSLLALLSGIGGVLAYALTPLNEVVNSWIWTEKAELVLVAQHPIVREGDVFSLDVFVQANSPASISEGILTVTYPADIARATPEARLTLEVPKLTGSKRVTSDSLNFLAQVAGKGEIGAQFVTKNGLRLSKSLAIEVLPASSQPFATLRNFSGTWNIDLGRVPGTMSIVDKARTVNGDYRLANGEYGQIEGTRDGNTFRTTFYRGAKPSRWWISGAFDLDAGKDLEITGTAELLIAAPEQPTGWKRIAPAESFHAVARRP
jgi:hypothetical protein